MSLTLKENFFWSFLGNGVYGVFQWLVIIVLCKMGSPEMVGHYALGISICTPVFVLASLNMRFVQATDAHHLFSFSHYWGLRLITSSLALLIVLLIVMTLGYQLELAGVILMLGIFKLLEGLSDTIYGFLQRNEQMNFIGISLVIKSGLALLALVITLSFGRQLFWGVSSLVLASALTLIWYDCFRCRQLLASAHRLPVRRGFLDLVRTFRPAWEKTVTHRLVRISLPLGLVGMLVALTFNIPRYFIQHYWGAKVLGLYSAMFQLMLAGSVVTMALGQALQPRLAIYFACRKIDAFCRTLAQAAGIAGLLGGVGLLFSLLFGKHLLTVFYNFEYARHASSFQWIMMAAIFYYIATILMFAVTAMRAFKNLLFPYTASVLLAGLSSWCLIPKFGIIGAAWSLCIINVFNGGSLTLTVALLLSKSFAEAIPSKEKSDGILY
jgi:O-antigen/teichoic acid export membrane protein